LFTFATQSRAESVARLKLCPVRAEADAMETSGVKTAQWRFSGPRTAGQRSGATATTPARVLAITDRCWRCRSKVRGIVGVMVDAPDGRQFVPFTEIAETLAACADERTLAARGIGPLRHRDSPGIQGGYVSNGCVECDALVGRLMLEDLLDEHLRNGGQYGQLDIGLEVELPAVAAAERRRRSA
jgi:hypothetical protein